MNSDPVLIRIVAARCVGAENGGAVRETAARAMTKTILVASRQAQLAQLRERLLEIPGYQVISIMTGLELAAACDRHIDLVVLGYTLPPAEKRRVIYGVRQSCEAPILELHRSGDATLEPATYLDHHHSRAPEHVLDAVHALLRT